MITMVVTHEDGQVDSYEFDPSHSPVGIGRRSDNAVCIPSLSVSGHHARLHIDAGSAWIEDLESTNGTYVNGQLISRQRLSDQDELIIGKVRLQVQAPELGARQPVAEQASGASVAVAAAIREPQQDATGNESHEFSAFNPGGAMIQIRNGAKSGQTLPIDKPVTTLGRPGIQIAAIMRKPDGYFLMHIESDEGVEPPTVNRDSIGDDPVLLRSGDRLNVAGIDVEFMLAGQTVSALA